MSWPTVKLGTVIDILSGFAFDSNKFNKENGQRLIRIRDVKRGYTETFYCGDYDKKYLVSNGEILIGMDGEFNAARWNSSEALLNQRVCKIKPNIVKIDDSYLLHFLPKALKRIEDSTPFVTVKHLSVKSINDIGIKLPPLAEQKRIAAILDKADEIKRKREQAIAKLDQLAQSIFVEMFGGHKFNTTPIANVVEKKAVIDSEVEDMVWSLTLDQVESITGYVKADEKINRNKLGTSTYYFKPPVILYSKLRPYLNKVVMPDQAGYATTELVPLYCVEDIMHPVFLLTYLRSQNFVDYANTNSGGAKMPRVIMDKFWSHPISLPPIALQEQFATRISKLEKLKASNIAALEKHNQLFASLQSQAFTGQL